MPKFTQDEINNYFKDSSQCTIMFPNHDIWICSVYEIDTHLMIFNPIVVDGYIDENQSFQYFFKKVNIATDDEVMYIGKDTSLILSNLSALFKDEYKNYLTEKYAPKEEKVERANVVSISSKLH